MDNQQLNRVAVIYARYSSDRQNEQSIEGQIRVITEYAARNNIRIIGSYIDRAMTGRSDDRPEFQKMISDAKNKTFDSVLVYKFDRFSRDRFNSLMYKKELKKYGVKVISATEYISDDPQGILLESIIDGYAEFYSAELAEKVKRGNRESRLKGQFTGGLCIYGYKIVNKKYVIVPEEAEIIKEIFNKVNNKVTMREICEDLNGRGLQHHGSPFTITYIAKVIRNPKYIGKCYIKGELYENIVPPIIDEETFNMACNNTIDNKRRSGHYRTKIDFYLSGKAFCGYCGEPLYGETGTSKSGAVHGYYKCKSNKRKAQSCQKTTIKRDELDDMVIEYIKTAIIESDAISKYAERLCESYNKKAGDDCKLKLNAV